MRGCLQAVHSSPGHFAFVRFKLPGATMHQGEAERKSCCKRTSLRFWCNRGRLNEAMISNDVERIPRCTTDGWVLVTQSLVAFPARTSFLVLLALVF